MSCCKGNIARPRKNEAQNWEHHISCCHANLHLTLSGTFLSMDSSSDVRTTLCLCLKVQGCTCVLSLGMGAWSPTCGSWCQWNNEVSFTYRQMPQALGYLCWFMPCAYHSRLRWGMPPANVKQCLQPSLSTEENGKKAMGVEAFITFHVCSRKFC